MSRCTETIGYVFKNQGAESQAQYAYGNGPRNWIILMERFEALERRQAELEQSLLDCATRLTALEEKKNGRK